jgi:hypothetical protein
MRRCTHPAAAKANWIAQKYRLRRRGVGIFLRLCKARLDPRWSFAFGMIDKFAFIDSRPSAHFLDLNQAWHLRAQRGSAATRKRVKILLATVNARRFPFYRERQSPADWRSDNAALALSPELQLWEA